MSIFDNIDSIKTKVQAKLSDFSYDVDLIKTQMQIGSEQARLQKVSKGDVVYSAIEARINELETKVANIHHAKDEADISKRSYIERGVPEDRIEAQQAFDDNITANLGKGLETPAETQPVIETKDFSELSSDEQKVELYKATVEEHFEAYDKLRNDQNLLGKLKFAIPGHHSQALASIAKANEMLKEPASEINMNDVAVTLSLSKDHLEKAGVDVIAMQEGIDTRQEDIQNLEGVEQAQSHNPEPSLNSDTPEVDVQELASEGISDIPVEESLTPEEAYKQKLEQQYEAIEVEQIAGVYKIKVRQNLAEQKLMDEGHPELVEDPEVNSMEKIGIATQVTAEKFGIEMPEVPDEGLTEENIQEFTNEFNVNLAGATYSRVDSGRSAGIDLNDDPRTL